MPHHVTVQNSISLEATKVLFLDVPAFSAVLPKNTLERLTGRATNDLIASAYDKAFYNLSGFFYDSFLPAVFQRSYSSHRYVLFIGFTGSSNILVETTEKATQLTIGTFDGD